MRGMHERAIPRPYLQRTRQQAALDRIDPLRQIYSLAVGRIDRMNVRAASLVLTNSQFTRQSVRRIYGVDAQVNHPGVDVDTFRPRPGPRQAFVLSVGALQPAKGFDFVVDSLATVPRQQRPRLLIISNFEVPGERDYLQRLADERSVAVGFRVGVSNDELVEAYGRATVTAYAPIREPLGLAALESQACETPVVGVAEGGVLETILDRRTGVLAARDADAYGAAIAELQDDPGRRQAYGRAARTFVSEKWSWERSAAELEQALNQGKGSRTQDRLV
jgi:glycosyltransferase involved in cell wall biosynthesis